MRKVLCGTLGTVMAAMSIVSSGSAVLADNQVEITWMHKFDEDGTVAWAEEIVKKFEDEHPDIKVNIEMSSADNYAQLLKTKIASDDAPNVFFLDGHSQYIEYVEADRLYPLDDVENLKLIDETAASDGVVDGVQYAVPMDVNAYGIHYNKDIFDEYDLEVPTTLTELREVCDTFVENGIQPFAAGFATAFCVWFTYETVGYPVVGQDENWFADKMDLTSTFSDDEAFKETIKNMMSLKEYWGEDPFGTDWDAAQNMMANGEAAMLVNGSWTVGGVLSRNEDCNIRICAMPTSEDEDGAILEKKPGAGICVYNSEDEEKLAASLEFFNYLLSEEAGNSYASEGFKMSTLEKADFSFSDALMDVQKYDEDHVWTTANMTTFTSEYESVFWEEITNLMLDDEPDIDAMCEALDKDFAAIAN